MAQQEIKAGTSYTPAELMAYAAAQQLEDKKSVLVGTGLPIIATMFAQRTHAPNLLIIFEAGGVGAQIPFLPTSVGDERTFHRAIMATSMHDVMSLAQAGYVDYGFLGAAQIDMYGNINTTVIGPHDRPKTRFPGSGGANDVGSLCSKTIIIMRQRNNSFVRKLDFLTTPGYLTGPGAREKAGLPTGSGPFRVITQLGVYGFDDETKRLKLLMLHPGVSLEQVKANSEFELIVPEKIETTRPPSSGDCAILRQIDPLGVSLG